MGILSLFLLKSIGVSGLLTAWYLLGLRGRRLHQYNRFFLLSVLFFSLAIPFLHFRLFNIPVVTGRLAPVARFIQPAGDYGGSLNAGQQNAGTPTDWQSIVALVAAGISLTLLIILSARIIKVRRMCRQCAITQVDGISLVLTDSPGAPFTFLKYIFWNRSLPLQDEIGKLIFRHERAHIQQGHTYDKLACQVLSCIFWFNPFYWIIQRELNLVHEFIADECAVANRDTEAFAMMLLRSYSNGSYLVPQHYFYSSTTKRRLAMLQNAVAPSYPSLRCFIAAPLMAGTVLLFSFSCHNAAINTIALAKKKIVVLLDAGHGGMDAGARSGGYIEKDICLKYAQRIKELSAAYNVDVQLTRNDDKYVVLANRVAMTDKIHPDVFISLHVGDEPGKDVEKGEFDIFVSGENSRDIESDNYSGAIFLAMAQNGLIPGNAPSSDSVHASGCDCSSCISKRAITEISATQKDGLYVLTHIKVPAMMMVLGNIKNPEGMQQLADDSRRDLLCNAILKGIVSGAEEKDLVTSNTLNGLLGGQVSKCH